MKPALTILPLAIGAHASSMTTVVSKIAKLFPDNIAFKGADATVSALETQAGKILGYQKQETRSDLADGGGGDCGDVMVIFARGTGEPGNFGALVGPEFVEELEAAMPGSIVKAQGVDRNAYSAKVAEYFTGGSETGAKQMATYVEKALDTCNDTSVVMSGWSQGAQVVHKAADRLGAAKMKSVGAVVTFGDPNSKTSFPGISSSKVKVICHDNDDICQFGSLLKPTHFTYAKDTPSAASWVASKL